MRDFLLKNACAYRTGYASKASASRTSMELPKDLPKFSSTTSRCGMRACRALQRCSALQRCMQPCKRGRSELYEPY